MKYYFDTEFLEGTQKKMFGRTKPTIDLISIGMVDETDREYYAISKDFNLKEAWNRFQIEKDFGKPQGLGDKRVYWLRENVLKPIWMELYMMQDKGSPSENEFTYHVLKKLIKKYGKTNKQIAEEIKEFCKPTAKLVKNPNGKYNLPAIDYKPDSERTYDGSKVDVFHHDKVVISGDVNYYADCVTVGKAKGIRYDLVWDNPEFYADFCNYDWVVFCWLFGNMIDLPSYFPMYCNDLQQILNNKIRYYEETVSEQDRFAKGLSWLDKDIKDHPDYPKQTNEHNALDDAKWNKKLHEFLNNL